MKTCKQTIYIVLTNDQFQQFIKYIIQSCVHALSVVHTLGDKTNYIIIDYIYENNTIGGHIN